MTNLLRFLCVLEGITFLLRVIGYDLDETDQMG